MNQRTARTVGEDLIDFIRDRTSKGLGKDNKPFPKYSKAYKESFEFKVAGKTNTVDLELTGEMMDSLIVLSVKKGEIEIGYPPDSPVNGRAEGNILGSYGGDPDPSKARNFLALSEKEVKSVTDKYPVDQVSERLENLTVAELARILAGEIAENIGFE